MMGGFPYSTSFLLLMRLLVFLVPLLIVFGCDRSNAPFSKGRPLGAVDARIPEASGLVASKVNPGFLWTHNDSGHPAEIFLIDTTGRVRLTCRLAGVANRDWEDIALGTGPDSTRSYIYIADIGDNEAKYPVKILYRLEEPVLTEATEVEITQFDTLFVKLDDGQRDTETILIDPLQHGMYFLSKREDSVHFYKVNYPYEGDTLNARFRVKLPFHNIVAGEISPDGTEVVIKDYDRIYYWKRPDGGPISKLLQTPFTELPYKREPQGEAFTFARDGAGFYTLSEKVKDRPAELRFYERQPAN